MMKIKKLIPLPLRTKLKLVWKRVKYRGTGRVCPICNGECRVFGDFGYIRRENAQCVWCGSLERHRFAWMYFNKKNTFSNLRSDSHFLHIAPEAFFEKRLRRVVPGKYTTADLLDPTVNVKMDITDIRYPDHSFDLIYCSHVLEHVSDDRRALREFQRVLTSNGTAIFMVPITVPVTIEDPSITDPQERFRLFGQTDHVRRYGSDFEERLRAAGFLVNRISASDFLSEEQRLTMGITPVAGDIYECHRNGFSADSSR